MRAGSTSNTTVALLGTGIMGGGMARNLVAAQLPVRAWNRTREKAERLTQIGAEVTDTPAEAVRDADVVITMLYDADSVEQAMTGPDGAVNAAPEGMLWIQMSTVGVAGTDRLAGIAREHGLGFVDAPVLGTKQPAAEGQLIVLASGPDELREECTPIFDAVGRSTRWLGPAGTGSRLKLVVNAWVLALVEATAESISLAQGLGIDPQAFLDTIEGTSMDSPYAQMKAQSMLAEDFPTSFAVSGAWKDTGLIVEAGRDAGVDLALIDAAHRHFERAMELGHAEKDMAATYYAHQG